MDDDNGGAGDALSLRKQLEQHLDELPVLPTVVSRLMTLDPDGRDYFDNVLELIESEPNFAARILAAANSAASAPSSPVTTLPGAIARLGAGGASRLVIAISITRVFVPRDDWEKSLWRHAIQVAVTTRALAESSSDPEIDPSEAYVCGLLHDVGRFVMFQEAPDQLRQIDEGDWDTPEKLVSQELAICGITHAELGAMACAKWGLPPAIEQMVRHHHRSDPALAGTTPDKLAALVRVADLAMFPSAMPGTPGLAEADDGSIVHLAGRLPPSIGLTMAELRELIVATTDAAEATCIELGVS